MLDVWYVAGAPNGNKKEFVFNKENNLISISDIRDYSWTYDEQFDKIRQFRKKLSTRKIPITFFQRRSGADNELYKKAQDMYEMFDRDVRNMKMGQLYVGTYVKDEKEDKRRENNFYINCYITGSKKKAYDNGVAIKTELTITSDFEWHRDPSHTFGDIVSPSGGGSDYEYLDFGYDFLYDYGVSSFNDLRKFQSNAITDFDFKIEFWGAVDNPELIVGETDPYYWEYRVFASCGEGERIVIDSLERAVYKLLADGVTRESLFDARDRDWYIFQPMPTKEGQSRVVWQEGHKVTLTAYLKRSTPPWLDILKNVP